MAVLRLFLMIGNYDHRNRVFQKNSVSMYPLLKHYLNVYMRVDMCYLTMTIRLVAENSPAWIQ